MSYPLDGVNEARQTRQLDGSRWVSAKQELDGFGRTLKRSSSEDGNHFSSANFTVHTNTIYDGLGRPRKTTNPYRGTSAATDGWARTSYDLAGRVIEVATFSGSHSNPPPDSGTNSNWTGSVITTYSGEVTTVRDQAGKQRRSTTDALGRLTMVEELFAHPSTTIYATTTYGYDLSSNLTSKIDARSITISFVYDALNRVTSRTYNDGTSSVSYVYDSSTVLNSKGRLTRVSSTVSAYDYNQYDALGRVKQGSTEPPRHICQ